MGHSKRPHDPLSPEAASSKISSNGTMLDETLAI